MTAFELYMGKREQFDKKVETGNMRQISSRLYQHSNKDKGNTWAPCGLFVEQVLYLYFSNGIETC